MSRIKRSKMMINNNKGMMKIKLEKKNKKI